MFSSGSPFVSSFRGVVSAADEGGMKETDTDVGEIVDAGRDV